MGRLHSRRKVLTRNQIGQRLDFELSATRTVRNKFLWIKSPKLWYLVTAAEQTNAGGILDILSLSPSSSLYLYHPALETPRPGSRDGFSGAPLPSSFHLDFASGRPWTKEGEVNSLPISHHGSLTVTV